MSITDRLFLLRTRMMAIGIDAYIIPSSDPHISEYPADHWKQREWISGFTGSSGTIVVLADEAALLTDSRYALQAEKELEDTGIDIFINNSLNILAYADYIAERLDPSSTVGFNGMVFSVSEVRQLMKKFKAYRIQIDLKLSLVEDMWEGRPPIPDDEVFLLETKYTGIDRKDKIATIREKLMEVDASHYIITSLDEIAWTLNMRGNEVKYNPVFHAYLIISLDSILLFIDPHKMPSSTGKSLAKDDIRIHLYEEISTYLKGMPADSSIMFDPATTNASIASVIPKEVIRIEKTSPVVYLKACKNDTEIAGMKNAHVKDGVAMIKFIHWLENNISKQSISEGNAAKELRKFRKEQDLFVGESFETISGYGEHGAIVHYKAQKESESIIGTDTFYLLDSGGQYLNGTTDITRTFHFGTPSERELIDFTLVLKGHIAIATTNFPKGTKGAQLDILARKALWSHGLNYGHGTGHGVGCFLNVHEGPQSIRPADNGVALLEGMITSNEPGLYREGKYGIRIENLILTNNKNTTEYGDFLGFETLTLCPIELKCIKTELLSTEEKEWLNNYHQDVYNKLSTHIDNDLKEWLKTKTKLI